MDVLKKVAAFCLFCSLLQEIKSLDNGLAVTPPSKYIVNGHWGSYMTSCQYIDRPND